jgi:hypothetical protein
MNFQEKVLETTTDLRARAAAIAEVAVTTARARAKVAAKRVGVLKGSFAVLTIAGRELNKVARRHAVRFVKENSSIAANAGKDVTALARSTYVTLTQGAGPTKARKAHARKRATRKAA